MGTTVDHGMDASILIPSDDNGNFAHCRSLVVTFIWNIDFQAQKVPHRPSEYPLLLARINFLVGIQPVGNAGDTALWPV